MGDVENDDLRLGFQPLRRVGEGEQRKQSPGVSILRSMKPTQFWNFRKVRRSDAPVRVSKLWLSERSKQTFS